MTSRAPALRKAENLVFSALRLVLIVLMTVMVCAVLGQVVARYILHASLTWSEELARICMVCLVFLGAALLVRRHDHLSVTALVDLLPDRGWHLARAFACGVGLYCAVYLLRGSWSALGREWAQVTPALQMPFGAIYSMIFAGVVLMILWLLINLALHLRGAVLNEGREP
jgi:TRAP-type C4-dicarboxylate transport system permease small subunit